MQLYQGMHATTGDFVGHASISGPESEIFNISILASINTLDSR